MIAAGENVQVVSELLGHSAPTITQAIYDTSCRVCRRAQANGLARPCSAS